MLSDDSTEQTILGGWVLSPAGKWSTVDSPNRNSYLYVDSYLDLRQTQLDVCGGCSQIVNEH